MAYNPIFPVGYQPYTPFPQYQPQMQGANMPSANQPQQMMTPPTIHAEIVQVDGEQAAANFPVGAGASQMMIAKDESAIYVKTAGANGTTLDVFVKRPPAPPAPVFKPEEYIRKDEAEKLIHAILTAQTRSHDKGDEE